MTLGIINGTVVNHNTSEKLNILIENDTIIKVTSDNIKADKIIDAKNNIIVPGLIDMHVHFRDPGFEYKEDVISGSEAAVAGGVTTCSPMANTNPINDNASITKAMIEKCKSRGLIDLLPIGAISKGFKSESLTEMGDMLEAGAVAFSDDGLPVTSSELMRRALEYTKGFDSFIISHSEDKSLAGDGVINEGEISTITGLRGIPAETEEVMIARDILLSKLTGGHMHIAHVSTEWSLKLIEIAKNEGLNVTCEVTPHHFSFSDKELLSYDTNFKMNPPLRSEKDVNAMIEGIKKGIVDIIATDHAPHHPDEKAVEFDNAPFGITGLQTLIPLTLQLVKKGYISLEKMVELTSFNPAKLLKIKNKGEIKEGMLADITIIDTEMKYVFDEKINKSKSVNSPLFNKELQGAALYTIKNGRIVFEFPDIVA
jgi:dihydroorotase